MPSEFDFLYQDYEEPVILKDPNDLLGMKTEDIERIPLVTSVKYSNKERKIDNFDQINRSS
jgi:hypothetical protein